VRNGGHIKSLPCNSGRSEGSERPMDKEWSSYTPGWELEEPISVVQVAWVGIYADSWKRA
jgi:hypothetical protein